MDGYGVTEYKSEWREAYDAEARMLKRALGKNCFLIRQVGGTAIPFISSRPIIDMLVEVNKLERVPESEEKLRALGYTPVGGEEKKLYYERPSGPVAYRLIILEERRLVYPYLTVRHRLMTDKEAAEEYSRFKTKTYNEFGDGEEYERRKREYLDRLEATAPTYMEKGKASAPADTNYVAVGLCLGMGVGLCFGVAMGNIVLGLPIGLCIGLCVGLGLKAANDRKNAGGQKPEEQKPQDGQGTSKEETTVRNNGDTNEEKSSDNGDKNA